VLHELIEIDSPSVDPVETVLGSGDGSVGTLGPLGELTLEMRHPCTQLLDLGSLFHAGTRHGQQRSRGSPAIHAAMPARRAGAPRLLEWTGERLVPWAPDVQVVYEHYHRYLWARPLVAGRRVLDLGSGEGFGSALLADAAGAVTGIDIDPRAVEHSRLNYVARNLEYRVGSAEQLADVADDSFDAVVAFEMVEHVSDQEAVLAEAERVLAPDGLLIVSTPERRTYSDATGYVNPFHTRELTREEFTTLLQRRFSALALFAQRSVTGSRIEALSRDVTGRGQAVQIERAGDDWREAAAPEPLYLVAVAGNRALPELPEHSSLSDYGLALLDEVRAKADAVREERETVLLAERDRLITEVLERTREREEAHARAERAEVELYEMQQSVTWQFLERARKVLYGVIGRDSRLGRYLSTGLRRIGGRR